MKENKKIQELTIDEWIWGIFILLSLLNIYGDKLEKDCEIQYEQEKKSLAKKIFTLTIFISLLIYLYLSYKKYQVYKENKENNRSIDICQTRWFASILVVVASTLYLYCQLKDTTPQNPNII